MRRGGGGRGEHLAPPPQFSAFPLAPLLALFSNLVEIRLDAIKTVLKDYLPKEEKKN